MKYSSGHNKNLIQQTKFAVLMMALIFTGTYTMAQNRVEDSLVSLLNKSENDSVTMSLYNQLRRATYYSEPEVSKNYTLKFKEYAVKRKDSFHIALSNYYLGNADVTMGNYMEALPFYLKAVKYFEKNEDIERLSSVYNGIAAAYENHGNDSLSLKYFNISYDLSSQIGDERRMGIALNNISNVYKNRGETIRAIEYLERAVSHLQDPSYSRYLKSINANLANAYADANKVEKAKAIYESSLANLDTLEDAYHHATIMRGLGNVYTKLGNKKRGMEYFEKSFNKYSSHGFNDERLETMKFLIDAYYENNEMKKGMDLYYEYTTIKDSIFNADKDKNLTEALQKYEAEKKDKTLLEQALTIEKKSKESNRILFGLITLTVFSILLFLFFRKRLHYQRTIADQNASIQKQRITELQQKNKLLALSSMIEGQEAERLRIAKDLHDSLGGLLSSVKAHFTNLQKEFIQLSKLNVTGKTNELIDEACIEVRRISHNMMPHALSISGLEGALEDISQNLKEQGYRVTLEIKNLPTPMENTREVMIYRLVQEIISNIRKHAEADSILLQLMGFQKEIHLIVEDNGKGFDYLQAQAKNGLGVKSINSRVDYLDGTIDWDTSPGKGTSITINIPV